MKAINQEGQKIIDESLRVRRNNKYLIIDKIRSAIIFLKLKDIDSADNDIFAAYDLIQESLRNTFICIDGLKPLVMNDTCDAKNHNELYDIGQRFFREVCMKISSLKKEKYEGVNVVAFKENG